MTDPNPTPATELDVDHVRAQFPAIATTDGPEPWIHLENAGGSHLPRHVIDLTTSYLSHHRVQPNAPAGPARTAGDLMERGLAAAAATFDADRTGRTDRDGDVGDVHIGPSTSQNTYVLAQAIAATLRPGDGIVVTNQDHEANIGAWRRLADRGATIRQWSVDSDRGLLDPADLEALVDDRTRVICVTHASNLAATINPIAEVAEVAGAVGAMLVVDGVSWAPHAAIDVADLGCDVYLYSTYKTYGPHQGLMWTRAGLADELTNQGHWFNARRSLARLTPAGPDHASVAAIAGMVDYYDELFRHHFGSTEPAKLRRWQRIARVYDLVATHEERLMTPLLDFLTGRGVRIVGSTSTSRAERAPTIAFDPGPVGGAAVVEALAGAGIGVGHGHFYARRLVDAIGITDPEGIVRISAVHYNTVDEIERTIEALDRVL